MQRGLGQASSTIYFIEGIPAVDIQQNAIRIVDELSQGCQTLRATWHCHPILGDRFKQDRKPILV